MRRPSLVALIAVTVLFAGAALPARAADPVGENGVMVVLIDEGASPVQRDLDAAETVALTMARGTAAGTIAAAAYGVETNEIVSARSGPEGTRLVDDVISSVRSLDIGPARSDQFAALTASFAFLSRVDAAPGSRVAFITSGRILGESENTRERLRSVANLFAAEGWVIDVVTLPSTEPVLRDLMSGLATGSDGVFYDTGTAAGIIAIFEDFSKLTLAGAMDVEMHDNSATVVTLDIAPHTTLFSTVFIRQHSAVDVAVFSPNGTRAAPEMENVEIRETPSAVIIRIYSPVPGNWSLQGVGPASKLVATVDIDNPLVLKMIEQPPLPVGEPAIIEAAAFVGESPQLLSGAVIEATIRKASGTTEVVVLNDRGEDGDRFANDGIYSVRLSAPKSQGINSVSLELSWTDYAAVKRSSTAFRSESFPTLSLVEVTNVDTTAGKYATVARVQVRAGDYPFLMSAADIKAVLNGAGGQIAAIVLAVDEPEPGRAWEFDIAAIIPESGAYEIEVVLDSTFEGRAYSRTAPIVTTHAVILEEPLKFLGLPLWVVPTFGVLLVLLAGFAIWTRRKTSPFGYILDDQDRVVVDFARLERTVYQKLFSRNAVEASEAPGLPFSGGTFKFSGGDQVKLVHKRAAGDPSMRVNSRPAGPETELGDDVWLGVGGRLLTFQREHHSAVASSPDTTDSAAEHGITDIASAQAGD
ncbi:MAG: hypothetical protein J4N79_09730 [Chloroflexi bacterium]|nr:hypothetical protein [Chloroflexota bacterium]MCI0874538.1 hypothetical protein [Chloroflexota bacterium]